MKIISFFALVAALFSSPAFAQHDACDVPSAWHEWAVAGNKTVFLSHLPMFSSIHAYQVIIEVGFQNESGNADDIYLKDRATHPHSDYTLSPGGSPETRLDFILPEVLKNKTSFPGYLHRANANGKDTILATDLKVTIKRIVYFHQFQGAEKKPAELSYFLFGNEKETLLAHFISGALDTTKAPAAPIDFDQILSVETKPSGSISQKELTVYPVTVLDRPNFLASRLKKEDVKAVIQTSSGSKPILIHVNSEFHLEESINRQN
jgi:hypothetical protein